MGHAREVVTSTASLVVRPIAPSERERFDETLRAEHWLGAGLVGEVMRYVAIEDGEWCALVGFGSAALCVRSREELLSWSDSQRHRRLRYVTNNQRFCVLSERRRPNLASQVLSLTLRRLSGDFEARWGHPVVLVETFTDPALHLGTCYAASNFAKIGETAGYGRKAGRFVHHGGKKAYWLRSLRRDAFFLLTTELDHPLLFPRRTMSALDLNRLDLDSPAGLLARLEAVPDPRSRRGIRHRLAVILSIATLATLRGATSLVAIGEVAAELPEEALRRLSCRISPSRKVYVAPEESTIRRTLKAIDANAVDLVVNSWIAGESRPPDYIRGAARRARRNARARQARDARRGRRPRPRAGVAPRDRCRRQDAAGSEDRRRPCGASPLCDDPRRGSDHRPARRRPEDQ